ncbi:hypothetical protein [Frankia sp. AgKG'84/4]|uniref:hypothetical protein n=1 Tax=Frankia sp. AgKG'84/4 TaxID=573490 RepID=UPI00200EC7B2|nr:hypothetical protein [Frankia sp. AgKG'84/4]MCL9797974.1 hypothetical protein [Frankia sp. AgKG'84/4]
MRGAQARSGGWATAATLGVRCGRIDARSDKQGTHHLLRQAVHIDDGTTGTVRLKRNAKKIDEMVLDTRSTGTLRVSR